MASAYSIWWESPDFGGPSSKDQQAAYIVMDRLLGYSDPLWTERRDAQDTADTLNQYLRSERIPGTFLVKKVDTD